MCLLFRPDPAAAVTRVTSGYHNVLINVHFSFSLTPPIALLHAGRKTSSLSESQKVRTCTEILVLECNFCICFAYYNRNLLSGWISALLFVVTAVANLPLTTILYYIHVNNTVRFAVRVANCTAELGQCLACNTKISPKLQAKY